MIITVASGKGGTGKTFASVHLYAAGCPDTFLADCDVEEPNALLFLQEHDLQRRDVYRQVPVIDHQRCRTCGTCSSFCSFGSIALLGDQVKTFPDLCRSCGGCTLVCPEKAITEKPYEVGYIEFSEKFIQGVLKVGSVSVVHMIREVISHIPDHELIIIDGPPGVNCPAMAAVAPADHVLLVGEPTPFGLHDITRMAEALEELGKPFSVLVNKVKTTDDIISRWCRDHGYRNVGTIHDDYRIRQSCVNGELSEAHIPVFKQILKELI